MRPDWERDGIQLYCADCMDVLPHLSGVDAVVTDPPYGIGINRSNRLSVSRGFAGETWDDVPPDDHVITFVVGMGSQAIIWGGNYFSLPPCRGFFVWDKQNDDRDFADCEFAWSNIDAVARIHRQRPMNMDGGKVHPTQKPIALMIRCVEAVSAEKQTVLDPFMGSGSSGVACVKLGRKFIGIEKEPRYFEISVKRIERALSEERSSLFPVSKEIQRELI